MINGINHIGIAVKDLDKSVEIFRKIFSFEDVLTETVESQKVKIASFKVGGIFIELTAPTDDSSPIARFLASKGEGIHHLAFQSDNIEKEILRLKSEGIALVNDSAQQGAHDMLIAFLHPKSTNGVLTEICQNK